MEDNNPSAAAILEVINKPGFQPGDISHTEAYEDMIHNMAARMRGFAGEAIPQMTDPIKTELKIAGKFMFENPAIKDLKKGSFYFLNNQNISSDLKSSQHVDNSFDVELVRKDFPVLQQNVHGDKQLVWLDNAATSQKPIQVIDTINDYYRNYNSNIHRGAHELAARATDAYELARKKVQRFMGADSENEIVFVRGTTEGINLVAQTFGKSTIGQGDEIILSASSHHAN